MMLQILFPVMDTRNDHLRIYTTIKKLRELRMPDNWF